MARARRKAAAALARHHARVANVRADALHKATGALAARYATVVVEDLNVTGMLANRRIARAVADQGFGTARRMLGYKTGWNGGTLIVADRWYPSSKTCSACGWRKPSLMLADRTFDQSHPPGGPARSAWATASGTGRRSRTRSAGRGHAGCRQVRSPPSCSSRG